MAREDIRVVSDFLPENLYADLVENRDSYAYRLVDQVSDISQKHEADLPEDISLQIKKVYEEKVGPTVGYWRTSIVRCDPGYRYPVHADISGKLQSTVLYLYPEVGDGTRFVEEGELRWKPNRLITWKNKGQLHSYKNSKPERRYTLNIYQQDSETKWAVYVGNKPSK